MRDNECISFPRRLCIGQREPLYRMSTACKYLSFDVFDTLVSRIWLEPWHVFIWTAIAAREAGYLSDEPLVWAKVRVKAERAVRARNLDVEISIGEIYEQLAAWCNWDSSIASKVQSLEIECERKSSVVVGKVADSLSPEALSGRIPVAISDFYIDGDFVRGLLAQSGIRIEPNNVYVSCDWSSTKRSGSLFLEVLKDLNCDAGQVHHTGDNFHSDVTKAVDAGLSARHLSESMPTRLEQRLAKASGANEHNVLRSSLIAGAARSARLSTNVSDDERSSHIWAVSTSVVGPLLMGYVIWVLTDAAERGVRRLFFLSRDGQILAKIAREVVMHLGLDIECVYLFASRQAWFVPSVREVTTEELRRVLPLEESKTPRDCFQFLGLSQSDLDKIVNESSSDDLGLDEEFTDESLGRFLSNCEREPLRKIIENRVASARESAIAYLFQEGMNRDVSWAIVDVGWKGRLQHSLGIICRLFAPELGTPEGYYLALQKYPDSSIAGPTFEYFVEKNQKKLLNASLIELFCAADHGSVSGYELASNNRFVPKLKESGVGATMAWGLATQQAGVLTFSEIILKRMSLLPYTLRDWCQDLRAASLSSYRCFVRWPSCADAEVYGAFSHASDSAHSIFVDMAPKLSMPVLFNAILTRKGRPTLSFWPEGAIVRSVAKPRYAYALIVLAKSLSRII